MGGDGIEGANEMWLLDELIKGEASNKLFARASGSDMRDDDEDRERLIRG